MFQLSARRVLQQGLPETFSALSATSSEVVTRMLAPRGAKARATAARCAPLKLKISPPPPGMRIKAPTRTTREKVVIGPLP